MRRSNTFSKQPSNLQACASFLWVPAAGLSLDFTTRSLSSSLWMVISRPGGQHRRSVCWTWHSQTALSVFRVQPVGMRASAGSSDGLPLLRVKVRAGKNPLSAVVWTRLQEAFPVQKKHKIGVRAQHTCWKGYKPTTTPEEDQWVSRWQNSEAKR